MNLITFNTFFFIAALLLLGELGRLKFGGRRSGVVTSYNHQVSTQNQLSNRVWELENELAQAKTQAFSAEEKKALEVRLAEAKSYLPLFKPKKSRSNKRSLHPNPNWRGSDYQGQNSEVVSQFSSAIAATF